MQEATEYGACGIAILLVLKLTEYTVVRRSRKGSGVDYWLGYKNSELPFQDAARLEVSGILNGNEYAVQARLKQKLGQTTPSDSTQMPVYVIVVEFGQPTSHLALK